MRWRNSSRSSHPFFSFPALFEEETSASFLSSLETSSSLGHQLKTEKWWNRNRDLFTLMCWRSLTTKHGEHWCLKKKISCFTTSFSWISFCIKQRLFYARLLNEKGWPLGPHILFRSLIKLQLQRIEFATQSSIQSFPWSSPRLELKGWIASAKKV